MKPVNQVVPGAARALRTNNPQMPVALPLGVVDDQTGTIVEKIFRQLQAIFPAWKQAWPDKKALESAQRSWTKGFIDAGINDLDQVRYGIEECRRSGSPFAPSIGQFIGWCTPGPERFGMPTAAAAWVEALMGVYSHEAVRLAAQSTGIFDLRAAKQSDKGLNERFDRNYEIVLRRAQAGQPLDGKILTGIGHDSQKTAFELANELADQQTQARILQQGIPADGKSARALLLAKFGKNKDQEVSNGR
jgi:hypothetical protein